MLFYPIIKNHPLEYGTKRSAVVHTMLFQYLNSKVLSISPDDLYDVSCRVAESDATQSEEVVKVLKTISMKTYTTSNS